MMSQCSLIEFNHDMKTHHLSVHTHTHTHLLTHSLTHSLTFDSTTRQAFITFSTFLLSIAVVCRTVVSGREKELSVLYVGYNTDPPGGIPCDTVEEEV